jgi:ribonuclease J
MNCLAIETAGAILVVDCGVTFPHTDLGVDVFHPDLSYLEVRRDRIAGVVLTHGHEDHIGGLPYLLRRIDVPVWAPCHALGLASERLEERGYDLRQLRLRSIRPGQSYQAGPFRFEPVRVTHSITDACALLIRSGDFTLIHTGDFKFDPNPPDGEPTDEQRLAEIGQEGVDLLLSDSTNIDTEGASGSEDGVGRTLDAMVGQASHRVIVGMFSSNVQRLRMVGEIARKHGRRLCLLGRSVNTQVRVATKCGRLSWPSDLLIPPDGLAAVARDRVLVVASGTQAEPVAALSRLSVRTHPALRLDPGDMVLMSSRIIPGNDPAVFRMLGNFIRQAVEVRTRITHPELHVSGHAHREEQRRMLELVRPRHFIPIHGTLHHLKRHADFARSLGIDSVLLVENGDVVELTKDRVRKTGVTEVGKVATYDGEEIPEDVLRQREVLGRSGIAVVTLMVDVRGQLLAPPFVSTRGVLDEAEELDLLKAATHDVAMAFAARPFQTERPTDAQIVDVAERAIRRSINGISGRRPVAIIHVARP